ncbi:Crp/Fnr family transcriptional regulator [Sphingomonas morindae]|uniref:Crp/Fnr family transcriptional regulator n=1 Tax=Sphingomonas morindae TaxID=1541170 RepID=A0ABY4X9C6_9SPHN|nr:Crp/Fnr family transcriptional regulator [Sphingomonas morindae]USI73525.1 Crp/Fnr family transcriptional regulator [Sphingomonas morindae]
MNAFFGYETCAGLDAAGVDALAQLGDPECRHRAGETFQREGDASKGFYLHLRGWIISSVLLSDGNRMVQNVHLPGDVIGLLNVAVQRAAGSLTAVTDASTSFVPFQRLQQLLTRLPEAAMRIAYSQQVEHLSMIDKLATIASGSARQRLATFLIDLHDRLTAVGEVKDDTFTIPLTQKIIGDALGLTGVHVNRCLRGLEEDGLVSRRRRVVQIRNVAALRAEASAVLHRPILPIAHFLQPFETV